MGPLLFVEACGIFSCSMQTLNCGRWDLVPWQEMESRSLHWELGVLATGPWGKSQVHYYYQFFFFLVITMQLMGSWASLLAQMVKNQPAMQETWVRSLGWEDPLEEGMVTYSSILAWRSPWTEEPDGLQSTGPQRLRDHSSPTRDWTRGSESESPHPSTAREFPGWV